METPGEKRKMTQGSGETPRKKRRRTSPLQVEELMTMLNSWSEAKPFSNNDFIDVYTAFRNGNEKLIVDRRLDRILWKAHHAKLTSFRKRMTTVAKSQQRSTKLRKRTITDDISPFAEFINNAVEFHKDLVSALKAVLHGEVLTKTSFELYMHLGDLCRYREDFCISEDDAEHSKYFYEEALRTCHCNGVAHNQLAVVGARSKDYIYTIYHYLRSIYISNHCVTSSRSIKDFLQKLGDKFAKLKREDFPDAFCRLAHCLLTKSEDLSDVSLWIETSIGAFQKLLTQSTDNPMVAIHVVTILVASVDDYYWGGLSDKAGLPVTYLLKTFEAAVRFAHLMVTSALEDPSKKMLPAVAVFFAWLASSSRSQEIIQATMAAEESRETFLKLLHDAESLLQAVTIPSQESVRSVDGDDILKGVPGLWEDKELRGFSLLNLYAPDEEAGSSCSEEQLNWIRSCRLEASLRIITKHAGLEDEMADGLTSDPILGENPTVKGFTASELFKEEDEAATNGLVSSCQQFQDIVMSLQETMKEDEVARGENHLQSPGMGYRNPEPEPSSSVIQPKTRGQVLYTSDLEGNDGLMPPVIPDGAASQMKARMACFRHLYHTQNPFIIPLG